MGQIQKFAAVLLTVLLLTTAAIPASAEFNRDPPVMITTGAPDKDGGMVIQLHGQPVQTGRDHSVTYYEVSGR